MKDFGSDADKPTWLYGPDDRIADIDSFNQPSAQRKRVETYVQWVGKDGQHKHLP